MKMEYHNPVLLFESVDGLAIKKDGIYVDVTFGGGGHSREILKKLGQKGQLFAFDQDKDALQNDLKDPRFTLIPENFGHIKRYLRIHGVKKVDGILADLGVSSHQFNEAERGFSTRFDAELDMRMDRNSLLNARTVVNEYGEKELENIFFNYGELRNAKQIAKKIIEARQKKELSSSFDLIKAVETLLPKGLEHKISAQIFQAIRIEVNQEMKVLEDFLIQTPELLNEKGRLVIISYHSLEDKMVKRFMKSGRIEGEPEKDFYGNFYIPFRTIDKIIVPGPEEIRKNSRARSAKLRIAERVKEDSKENK
jgi:16S rRNA (cytosine1402-N4)-methyltransferase